MKKFGMIAIALILTFSLCACGRRDNNETTTPTVTTRPTVPPTTAPTTAPTTEPTMVPDLPDMDTNIPDPTVDSNSTNGTNDETGNDNVSRSRNYRR